MTNSATLLVVDDNRNILTTVRLLMEKVFARVVTIANPNNIPTRLRDDKPDVVLLDMNFNSGINNGNEGLFWLRAILQQSPKTAVVLFTAYADIQLAVTGIKEGAADFVVKPFDNQKLIDTLVRAAQQNQHEGGGNSSKGDKMYWGTSETMLSLRQTVEKVAGTDANVIITGENGTGKEMLAREIHRLSHRSKGPMMAIDMGAVSETLFESELFGHTKGAFTDAKADKKGKFELAEGGTLFLDEIGNLSYSLQAKLLTAIQSRRITRVGGSTSIDIDVRLVCATNKDLRRMVAQGEFREDLLYRINTIHLHLPALRERPEDIAFLALRFMKRYADMYGKHQMELSQEAMDKISSLPWYGNIRELQHSVEKAVILSDSHIITTADIDCDTRAVETPIDEIHTIDEMERHLIEKAIRDCEGNLSQVASRLGISRQTLYNKIKRYGL